MKKTLRIINQLEKEGVFERYALGGAVALLFYAEPALTYGMDVFVFLPDTKWAPNRLIDLSPVYRALKGMGYKKIKCIY